MAGGLAADGRRFAPLSEHWHSVAESEEVRSSIVLCFAANGRLVGFDVDEASQHVALGTFDVEDFPAKITARSTPAA